MSKKDQKHTSKMSDSTTAIRELNLDEIKFVSGGVSDLGNHITKAVDEALSAAICSR
jgi:hypothetical protein